MTANGTQAIDRAAELLSRVVLADEPPGFNDLVTDTGLAKSTASRLLQALERHRLVHRDDAGGYEAGSLFAAVRQSGHEPHRRPDPSRQPSLEAIGAATGETVNLAIVRGTSVVQIAQIDSTFLLGTINWVDVDVPPTARRSARSSTPAAGCPLPTRAIERRTDHTITSRRFAAQQIETGPAQTGTPRPRGELEIGLDAIAAPVLDGAGEQSSRPSASPDRATGLDHQLPQLGRAADSPCPRALADPRTSIQEGGRRMTPDELLQDVVRRDAAGQRSCRPRP